MKGHVKGRGQRAGGYARVALVTMLFASLFVIASPADAAHAVLISESAGSTDVTEGGAPDTYTVALDDAPLADVTVTVTPDAQLRVNGATTLDLTFTPTVYGAQTVTVSAFDDAVAEGSHSGVITHVAASTDTDYNITGPSVTAAVTDDDPPPAVSIADAPTVTEGGVASFPVTLSGQSALPVTIAYTTADVDTTAGSDYTVPSGSLLIPALDLSGSIDIATLTDGVSEPQESFTVTLNGATNGTIGSPATGTGRINDDGAAVPTVSIADAPAVTEGGVASFPVTLSPVSAQQVTVNYTLANVTTTGADYTAPSGTLVIPPFSAGGAIAITTINDPQDEADSETFTVTLTGATNANLGGATTGTGTINDNDDPPTISIGSASVLEGGAVSFPVSLSAASGRAISVNYATSGPGTATAGTDYTVTTGTLSIPADTLPGPITVATATDIIDEGAGETFALSLSSPSNVSIIGGIATGTIDDDDIARFAISDAAVQVEEGVAASFTVSLSTPSSSAVSVDYRTVDATAVAPDDYTGIGLTTLIFAAGETTKPITVATIDDTIDEANETFAVNLLNSSGPEIDDASGIGTIIDGDGPPGLSVLDAAVVSEGPGTVQLKFTVALLPMSGLTVTADYTTADGTAVAPGDYVSKVGTVTFVPGDTMEDVLVTVANDALDEIDETVLLNITAWTNTGTPADDQAVGTIEDDDNQAPKIDKFLITDAAGNPRTTFALGETTKVNVEFSDPGVMDTHEVRVSWEDATPDFYQVLPGAGVATRAVAAAHAYQVAARHTITVIITDEEGAFVRQDAIPIIVEGSSTLDTVGLFDPNKGLWRLRNAVGTVKTLYYGNPGDYPFVGDWDCNGTETPGLYRQADGFVYLRNSNTAGIADIRFYFGNPGDIPLAGDFNGNGCDTVSIYRPSEGRVYIINALGSNNGGLGAAELSYYFGNPGDKPFVGDFNRNGVETIGLHRESTGLVYFRNSHTQGIADNQFYFGNPADRLVAGDWTRDGIDTPALFRPSNTIMYFRHSNTQGNADDQFVWGESTWLPVAGYFGL